MKAIGNKVIVIDAPKDCKTDTGIIYQIEKKEPTTEGKVVSVGKNITEISVGDIVIYDSYSGAPKSIDGVDYRILPEECILAVVD